MLYFSLLHSSHSTKAVRVILKKEQLRKEAKKIKRNKFTVSNRKVKFLKKNKKIFLGILSALILFSPVCTNHFMKRVLKDFLEMSLSLKPPLHPNFLYFHSKIRWNSFYILEYYK